MSIAEAGAVERRLPGDVAAVPERRDVPPPRTNTAR
jgi:hypothetical protein